MKPSPEAIARQLRHAPRRLIALDYDGTLAPYENDPRLIAIPSGTISTILAWAQVPRCEVAVISGRELDDVKRRLPPSVHTVGSHGRESDFWPDEGPMFPQKAVREWLESRLGSISVGWNPKRFGLGVDLRPLSPEERLEARGRLMVDCPVPGVKALFGRSSFEYVSSGAPDKGDAVRRLMTLFGIPEEGVVAIGDEVTDEDMFGALPHGITIRVGEGTTVARFRLGGLHEVALFLKRTLEDIEQDLSAG